MKITRKQLKLIIKEELELAIYETALPNTKSFPTGPDGEVINRNIPEKDEKWSFDVHPISGETNIKNRITPGRDFKPGPHNGIDYGFEEGTPILSIANGIVKKVYDDKYNGFGLDIEHAAVGGIKYRSQYIHMKELPLFGAGDTVEAGSTIGFVGNTGKSSGQHLHFQVKEDGKPVDPKLFYKTV